MNVEGRLRNYQHYTITREYTGNLITILVSTLNSHPNFHITGASTIIYIKFSTLILFTCSGIKPYGCEICGKFFRQRGKYILNKYVSLVMWNEGLKEQELVNIATIFSMIYINISIESIHNP